MASRCVDNTPAAVRRLLRAEQRHNHKLRLGPLLVVCEATGGYERHVLAEVTTLGLACHRAHGGRTQLFARCHGQRPKLDPIDARMLALYGLTARELQLYRQPGPDMAALRQLRTRRDQLRQMLRMETNRVEHATHPRIKASLADHCHQLERECRAIEAEIAALIAASPELARKATSL
ncbi:MAG: transposase [Aurantimonas endophytica]